MLEPIGSRLWPSGDWDVGGVQLLNGFRAVIQRKGHMVTTCCQGSSRIGGATGSTFLTLQDHMDLGISCLEPQARKWEVRARNGLHSKDGLVEVAAGLEIPGDHGNMVNCMNG